MNVLHIDPTTPTFEKISENPRDGIMYQGELYEFSMRFSDEEMASFYASCCYGQIRARAVIVNYNPLGPNGNPMHFVPGDYYVYFRTGVNEQ